MPKPPFVLEAAAENIDDTLLSILTPKPSSKQGTKARSPQSPLHLNQKIDLWLGYILKEFEVIGGVE